jgi:thiamine biosynthesis lipoprotein ApbE
LPTTAALEQATAAAACDRLTVDPAKGTATLAAGSQVDLWTFEAGAALDRAVDVLAAHGVRDASLTLGNVQRAVGGGPDGRGWPLRIAVPAAISEFTENLRLRDQSFALASREDGELRAGGERYAPYLDQSTGRPASGVLTTVAISQLALDAQGLAATLFVTGARRGGMLLGQLTPAPAALWVLGEPGAEPLVSDYRWGGRQRRGGG